MKISLVIPVYNALEDVKKCISLIKKEITKMTKGDFKDSDIESAKIIGINALKRIIVTPENIPIP